IATDWPAAGTSSGASSQACGLASRLSQRLASCASSSSVSRLWFIRICLRAVCNSPHIPIHNILQHLLTPRNIRRRVALVQHVLLQVLEVRRAAFDLVADTGVPGGVAMLDEVFEQAVGADFRRDLQAMREGVHAADVGVEEIKGLEAFAADFGVEVDAA